MQIGICGKTNVGKSTLFSAATLVDVEISNRVFTTIKPNVGVGYVRSKCPCREFDTKCDPQNSKCAEGTRLIPIKLIDIAGLVPGAHEGRGLGNQFLSDIMQANALIHVIDVSGLTDSEGNPTGKGDPEKDVEFLEMEMEKWMAAIIQRNYDFRNPSKSIGDVLGSFGLSQERVESLSKDVKLETPDEFLNFAHKARLASKPMIIAANKADLDGAKENLEILKDKGVVPCCAEAELALRRAQQKGLIDYTPGESDVKVIGDMGEKQKGAIDFVKSNVLDMFGSTGVQKALDTAVYVLLDNIVAYPVENENKLTDVKGNVLPHAFLMKKGSTAKDLAFKVHTDIGKGFIGAIDCRTKRKVGADYQIQDGDVIKIISKK